MCGATTINKIQEGWKDNQNHDLNIKELITELSECTNYVPRLGKTVARGITDIFKYSM